MPKRRPVPKIGQKTVSLNRGRALFLVIPVDVEDVRGADVRHDHAYDHSDPQVIDPHLASDGLAQARALLALRLDVRVAEAFGVY